METKNKNNDDNNNKKIPVLTEEALITANILHVIAKLLPFHHIYLTLDHLYLGQRRKNTTRLRSISEVTRTEEIYFELRERIN